MNMVRPKAITNDRNPKLLENQWYVAAFGSEVSREPMDRRIMGRSILMYRLEDGTAVALQNRCAHRSFPLSKGTIDGDEVVCGYHGMRFGSDGNCIDVPSLEKCPANIKIRNYPLVESGPYLWIWMGAIDKADTDLIPPHPWMTDTSWVAATGYVFVPGNYVLMHENLLDLTHFFYLHGSALGTDDYAKGETEVERNGNEIICRRAVLNSDPPEVYERSMDIAGHKVDRISTAHFISPGLHVGAATVVDHDAEPGERREYQSKILHALTPESDGGTHYFYAFARDYAIEDPEVTEFLGELSIAAFMEDVEACGWIEELNNEDETPGYTEVNVTADKAGLAMRRILRKMADQEMAG